MRQIFLASIAVLVGFSVTFAQGDRQGGTPSATASPAFDPRDLSGIWLGRNRVLTLSNQVPPRTTWGEAKFNSYKPSYGPRAVPPALGNDPQGNCDPLGIPRLLLFENNPWQFEIIQTRDRMLQLFDRHHVHREIWTDGRQPPTDMEPRFMGYAVGKWDGDTFVVNSTGLDERTWLDHFGNPHSDEMRLEERYRRVNRDTIEFVITLTDPKTYTRPWVSDKKTLTRQNLKEFPDELFCVPSEEQEFNRRLRDPAGGRDPEIARCLTSRPPDWTTLVTRLTVWLPDGTAGNARHPSLESVIETCLECSLRPIGFLHRVGDSPRRLE